MSALATAEERLARLGLRLPDPVLRTDVTS